MTFLNKINKESFVTNTTAFLINNLILAVLGLTIIPDRSAICLL
ncbi:MAG: hypothetical protein QX199_10160 [Methylococcaceae bacterium]